MNVKRHKIINFTLLLTSMGLFSLPCVAQTEPLDSERDDAQTECIDPKSDEIKDLTSIQETMENAYMQNTDLDATRAGLRATDETVSQAIGEWRPSLSVRGSEQLGQTYPIGARSA